MIRRTSPAYIRAAWWALRATRRARRQLSGRGLEALALPPAPPVDDAAVRGVMAVLHRTGSTCLVEAAVRQRWEADHGRPRELVVGVRGPSQGFEAHAWLEGDDPSTTDGFTEIHRRPAA